MVIFVRLLVETIAFVSFVYGVYCIGMTDRELVGVGFLCIALYFRLIAIQDKMKVD